VAKPKRDQGDTGRSLPARIGRSVGRRVGVWTAVIALGALLSHGFLGSGGLLELWRLHAALGDREARIEGLRAENRRLERAVAALRSDREAQERAVRNQLGYVRPGEVIYRTGAGR